MKTIQDFKDFVGDSGLIFSVTFIKKTTGEERKMTARLNVKKDVKGVGMRFNPTDLNHIVAYSMRDRGWRQFSIDNLIQVKANKQVYTNQLT